MNENQNGKPAPPPLPNVKLPLLPSSPDVAGKALPPPLPNSKMPPPLPSTTSLPPMAMEKAVNTPPPPLKIAEPTLNSLPPIPIAPTKAKPQLPLDHRTPAANSENQASIKENTKSTSSLIAVVILLLLLLLGGAGYFFWQKTDSGGLREFTDERALQLLYGNYDQSKHGVLWTISQAPKEFENWNNKTVLVVPFRTENFIDNGIEKKAFLTNTLDMEGSEVIAAGDGSHADTSLVGVAIFEKTYGKWQLVSENKFLSTGMGWGSPPEIKTNFYQTNSELVFDISGGFTNQGITESWAQSITFKNNHWAKGKVAITTEEIEVSEGSDEPVATEPPPSIDATQPAIPAETAAQAISQSEVEAKTGLTQLERALGDKEKVLHLANEEAAHQNAKDRATEKHIAKDQSAAIQTMLNKARNCLASHDYSCAITNAENVLNFEPSNSSAQDIENSAVDMQSEAISNIRID